MNIGSIGLIAAALGMILHVLGWPIAEFIANLQIKHEKKKAQSSFSDHTK